MGIWPLHISKLEVEGGDCGIAFQMKKTKNSALIIRLLVLRKAVKGSKQNCYGHRQNSPSLNLSQVRHADRADRADVSWGEIDHWPDGNKKIV